ncbi:uncharacterized protein LACBIDRAFT_321333 [Laccaria bicolor S238N-H82]|uniref:Predicted protein n=1 Tax=Laccaria bicolor (strain S238N-H82 / ATCC MYA-4686) TaxID=486041 RepID=B0CPM3_LACBS|nr:uncharacterized protein LACBIDRAFT_321333 [Laccaria bicolor S238N-H82]EDR15480.1 predicted protein [Laccaria bicolor S238N-H82]|eukprot:XP_001873688.1 predicted protein [Laccaria bicolor S238N-H82]
METITGVLGISNETYERYEVGIQVDDSSHEELDDHEKDIESREQECAQRELEARDREKGVKERERGAPKSSRFRQTISTHGVQVFFLKLLSDLETNSSEMGRSRVQRRLSEIQKQLGSVMIAGVETDMERKREYRGGGGKRKRRALAEGEAEGEEWRGSGKKARGGQSSSSSLNLPFEKVVVTEVV